MRLHKLVKQLMFLAVLVCIASLDISIEGSQAGLYYTWQSQKRKPSNKEPRKLKSYAAFIHKVDKKRNRSL